MFTKEFAFANKFILLACSDGNYWIRYIEGDNFYQVNEDGSRIQFYDGDVFDLTFEQLIRELNKL